MVASPKPLRRQGFRRLAAAQSISSIGDWLATFALMNLVLEVSGSTAAVGGVLALRLVPASVAGPLIGFAAARWGARTILVGLDLFRAGVALLIPLVAALWWIYPLSMLLEVAAVVAVAARDASIRDLVDRHDLPVANGMVLGATYGAIPVGAGAYTVIAAGVSLLPGSLADLGSIPAFWVDAATFLASAAIIRTIGEIARRPSGWQDEEGRAPRLRDAVRLPLVRATMPPVLAASLGVGSLFALGVGFVRETLGAGEVQFGILVLAFGFGAALGLVVRQIELAEGVRAVRLGVLAMGGVMVVMAFAEPLWLTLLMALLFGAGGALAIVSGITELQELDDDRRIIALGAFHVGVRMALAVGALAAGVAADLLSGARVFGLAGIRMVLLVSGAFVAASSLVVREPESASAGEPG